jgi:enoyl-CoA hydratase/carnithine racemase
MAVRFEAYDSVAVVTIDRPDVANAIDRPTADALVEAFRRVEADDSIGVAVLTGANGTFCAGADLKAMRDPKMERTTRLARDGDGPVGPTRMLLAKPVIGAVEGHAVAGGLEIAAWCDLRVAAEDAVFGVYCRRWGIPLMDGGTIRLARLIGMSHALDMILTGRGVSGEEARTMGLANRLVPPGTALEAARRLAREIASWPPAALRSDRLSCYQQWSMALADAIGNEFDHGMETLRTGQMMGGLERYASGGWKKGDLS